MQAGHRQWLSVHVFLADPVQTERYLRERLEPVIQRWRDAGALDCWFFIRYWEGGPHLRIRLAGRLANEENDVLETFSDEIATFCSASPPTREDYYRAHAFDGRPVAVAELPWFEEGTVTCIDYEPEILRYGGEHVMAANEDLFELSSRIALNVCRVTEGNRTGRLSAAFAFMATAILACGERMSDVGTYFQRYGSLWASRVGRDLAEAQTPPPSEEQLAMLRRLEAQTSDAGQGRSAYAAWAAGVRELAAHLRQTHISGRLGVPFDGQATVGDEMCRRAILDIVGSQIHMLNNRLGVPPAGEFFLAGSLARAANALDRQGEMA